MSKQERSIDQTLISRWLAQLDHDLGRGQAVRYLLRDGGAVFQRAWQWLRKLWAMPRHLRRRWRRKLGMSLAAAALFLALNSAPLLADTLGVTTTDDHLDVACNTINMTNVKQSPIIALTLALLAPLLFGLLLFAVVNPQRHGPRRIVVED